MNRAPRGPECDFHGNYEELPLSLLLQLAAHRHDSLIREKLEIIGVARGSGPLLSEISKHPGLSQAELAQHMHFKASTISVGIQKLLDTGLITRDSDENDARQVKLFISEDGRKLCQKIDGSFAMLEKELTMMLTPEETAEMKRLTIKLLKSMSGNGGTERDGINK